MPRMELRVFVATDAKSDVKAIQAAIKDHPLKSLVTFVFVEAEKGEPFPTLMMTSEGSIYGLQAIEAKLRSLSNTPLEMAS